MQRNVSIFQILPFARHGSCPLLGQASMHASICSSALSLQSNIELHKESWFKHLFWFGHFQRPELLQISTKYFNLIAIDNEAMIWVFSFQQVINYKTKNTFCTSLLSLIWSIITIIFRITNLEFIESRRIIEFKKR